MGWWVSDVVGMRIGIPMYALGMQRVLQIVIVVVNTSWEFAVCDVLDVGNE